uniref:Uncharacterized protein n=1 Tax=Anguilla anguilla TaxID=7936 RepID=A0A0E9QSX2_ANGAN
MFDCTCTFDCRQTSSALTIEQFQCTHLHQPVKI